MEMNENTEGAPTYAAIDTGARFVGPDAVDADLTDAFPAGAGDADDAFFDNVAAPNDGELWNEKAGTDTQIAGAGRNTNQEVVRALETGGSDGTADPPALSAYDDATDAGNRTAPTVVVLAGTAGSSNIGFVRAEETTTGAPAGNWATQVHDANPTGGNELDGNNTNEVCATVLALSGNKLFNIAACAPHDSPPGLTAFVLAFQYTFV